MDRRHRFSAIVLLATLAATPVPALAQDDVSVSLSVQGIDEQVNSMTITVSGDMARLDMGEQMSMVWSPDWWRMIQHANRMYMEFDKAMLERMRQVMGSMPGVPGGQELEDFDPSEFSFERTGATDTVMEYEVFEVAFSDGEGQQGSMWLSQEAEIGMFEIMPRLMSHLESIAGPMMGGAGGGGAAGKFRRYMQYARAQGLPDGRVLRMTADDGANFEVTGWRKGPFGADFWEAPDGYQKQEMPGFPR